MSKKHYGRRKRPKIFRVSFYSRRRRPKRPKIFCVYFSGGRRFLAHLKMHFYEGPRKKLKVVVVLKYEGIGVTRSLNWVEKEQTCVEAKLV